MRLGSATWAARARRAARGARAWWTARIAGTGTVLLGLVGALFLARVSGDRAPRGVWTARGYVARADSLILHKRQLELASCSLGAPPGGQRLDQIVVKPFAPGSPDELFYTESYLSSDVQRFNSDPGASPSPFVIDGCRLLGVNPYYHTVALPNSPVFHWLGDVRLAGGRISALLENRARPQTIEIADPERASAFAGSRVVSTRDSGEYRATLVQLTQPGVGAPSADLYFVGGELVLQDRQAPTARTAVAVSGYDVTAGSAAGRVVRLETGDWLRLSVDSPAGSKAQQAAPAAVYLATTGIETQVASFVRRVNDRADRVYPVDYLRPFVAPLTQAVDATLQEFPATRAAGATSLNVELAIDRELSDTLRRALRVECAAIARRVGQHDRPRAVSAILMDAFSGKVVAMPSCPEAEDVERFGRLLSTRERERWLRNQALVPHEIGSAGKPFWAAALATTFPYLLDLQVRAHPGGSVGEVLGCPLGRGQSYQDHPHGRGGWVAFEEFVQESCNRYIVELATAALAIPRPHEMACTGDQTAAQGARCLTAHTPAGAAPQVPNVRLCGQPLAVVRADAGGGTLRATCTTIEMAFNDQFFVRPFEGLTNVGTYRFGLAGAPGDDARLAAAGYRSVRYRTDAWNTVLAAFRDAGDTSPPLRAGLRFAGVSPEAANLALNTTFRLRDDWIGMLLGGANSRWSDFQLAEAMARLMTARQVTGQFASAVTREGPDGEPSVVRSAPAAYDTMASGVLHRGVRRRVLHAMELVTRAPGTAQRLAPLVDRLRTQVAAVDPADPYQLFVFAKTGTPNQDRFVSEPQQRTLRRAYDAGAIVWDARASRFAWTPAAAAFAADTGWIRREYLDAIEQDPDEYRTAANAPLPRYPFYLDGDQLRLQVLRDRRIGGQAGVLVLGVLAVPRSALRAGPIGDVISACQVDPALRNAIYAVPSVEALDPTHAVGVTAAFHVADLNPGQGSGYAVGVAEQMFDEIGAYLLLQVRQKAAHP